MPGRGRQLAAKTSAWGTTQRRWKVLQCVQKVHQVSAVDLMLRVGVSRASIRRDL